MKSVTYRGILLSLIFAVLFTVNAFAAQGVIYFSDPQSVRGEGVQVKMSIQSEGTSFSDITVTLKYPQDSLTFKEGTNASGGAGTIKINGVSDGASEGKCDYILSFDNQTAGQYTLNVDTYEIYDASGSPVEITHVGSSAITVNAEEGASDDSSLKELTVSPGKLTPAFSPLEQLYELRVGLSIDSISVNAIGAAEGSKVTVVNNEELKEGENDLVVYVTSPSGGSQTEYHINVIKEEGGATEAEPAETESSFADGVQLLSKGKTITVMIPGSDVTIPEGFKESAISIDGQKVQGWVWGAEGTPEYCVVYGMNEDGDVNFYRYDMAEKSIQRYFEDPLTAQSVELSKYQELEAELSELKAAAEKKKLFITILIIVLVLFFVIIVYFIIRIAAAGRKQDNEKKTKRNREARKPEEVSYEDDDLNETRVVRRSQRHRGHEDTGEAVYEEPSYEEASYETPAYDETADDEDLYGKTTVIKREPEYAEDEPSYSDPVQEEADEAPAYNENDDDDDFELIDF